MIKGRRPQNLQSMLARTIFGLKILGEDAKEEKREAGPAFRGVEALSLQPDPTINQIYDHAPHRNLSTLRPHCVDYVQYSA